MTKYKKSIQYHKEFRRALIVALRNSNKAIIAEHLNHFEDYLLLPILHKYLNLKTNVPFTQYVRDLEIGSLHPRILRLLDKAKNALLSRVPDFLDGGIIVGDFHGVKHSKWKVANTIYAPRLYWEDQFHKLIQECGFEKLFPKYTPTSTNWVFRTFSPIVDSRLSDNLTRSYYFHLGQILAVSSAMHIVDLHCENVARIGKIPYFFDLECAFTPAFIDADFSIKASGVIPDPNEENSKFDHSVLSGRLKHNQSLLKPILVNPERPSIIWSISSRMSPSHIPKDSKGTRINYLRYTQNIIDGYRNATAKISHNTGIIPEFNPATKSRILIRPSSIYKAILQEYFFPSSYEKYPAKDFFTSKLNEQKVLFQFTSQELLNIVQAEAMMLKNMEIPLFYLRPFTGAVEASNGSVVAILPKKSLYNPKSLRGYLERDERILVDLFSTHSN